MVVGIAAATVGAVLGAGIAAPVAWAVWHHSGQVAAGDRLLDEGGGAEQPEFAPPQPPGGGGQRGFPGAADTSEFADATAEQAEGVVLIEVASPDGVGAGTGWVLDADGLVVTNNHVVSGSSEITVTDATTGASYDAEVLGRDVTADVALLGLTGADDLAEVALDDDGDPALGDEVTAVGNPGGRGSLAASAGRVTDLSEDIETTDPATGARSELEDLIQTDARVVGGFSGGVLLDEEGEVVGITSAATAGGPAESYAVPIGDALAVVEQIEDGDPTGTVQLGPRPHLGVSVAGTGRVEVAEVADGGAAADAGVTEGAVITGLDGREVRDFSDLERILADLESGEATTLSWQDPSGAAHRATVTLGESPLN